MVSRTDPSTFPKRTLLAWPGNDLHEMSGASNYRLNVGTYAVRGAGAGDSIRKLVGSKLLHCVWRYVWPAATGGNLNKVLVYGGFLSHGGTPLSLDGKKIRENDNLQWMMTGLPPFMESLIHLHVWFHEGHVDSRALNIHILYHSIYHGLLDFWT